MTAGVAKWLHFLLVKPMLRLSMDASIATNPIGDLRSVAAVVNFYEGHCANQPLTDFITHLSP